jgi:hypothetical protein
MVDVERKALDAEKRKLEYDIYDLLQVSFAIISQISSRGSGLFVRSDECVVDVL